MLRSPGAAKTLALFVLPLLLQGMALAFLVWNEPKRRDAELQALLAERADVRAETAVRLLIQEKDHIAVALLTRSAWPTAGGGPPIADLTNLRRNSTGDPRRAGLAGDLLLVAKAMAGWISGVEALGKAGRTDEVARLVGVEGERLQKELLASLARFEAGERQVGQEGSERLASIRRLRQTVILGAGTASLLITLLGAGLFYRQISERLAMVAANARRIAENDSPASPLPGTDEISRLDVTIRETAFRLTETIRQREATLEENTVELASANRELRAKTEELEAFIRGVSHDLRSPLTYIKGFNREIELSCGDLRQLLTDANLEPEVRARFETIDRDTKEALYYMGTAVASADRIILALRELAKAGHRHFEWRTLDVQAIVTRVLDTMHLLIAEKSVEVVVGILPDAWGDALAVEQIFANLLRNAVNYLDPDRPGRVEVGADAGRPGAPVTYWVRDNGVGIPADRLPKVFSAFQRIRSDLAEGEGIGLALVHRSVNRIGGQIRVESQEGVGSTFFVTLLTEHDRLATPPPFSTPLYNRA